jgi:GDP-L-fucose synthase
MEKSSRIFVAGHRGLVGSAIVRQLQADGYEQILTRTRQELNLTDRDSVRGFFATEKPDYVFLAAAKVGGIHANNTYPAEFIYENLTIQNHVIHESYEAGVQKLLFLGSSCIYPKLAPQPMTEDVLLTGPLEETNEAYAVAKIAGLKMCQAYQRQYGFRTVSLMPTNLYGPNDSFDLANSHVLPALLRKFHEAKITGSDEVVIWGTGTPRREFLYSDDLAEAAIFLMNNHEDPALVNVGVGEDVSIRELAGLVKETVGFEGELTFDTSKPDGTPRKLMDVTKIHGLGWRAKTTLEEGIPKAYRWYVDHVAK